MASWLQHQYPNHLLMPVTPNSSSLLCVVHLLIYMLNAMQWRWWRGVCMLDFKTKKSIYSTHENVISKGNWPRYCCGNWIYQINNNKNKCISDCHFIIGMHHVEFRCILSALISVLEYILRSENSQPKLVCDLSLPLPLSFKEPLSCQFNTWSRPVGSLMQWACSPAGKQRHVALLFCRAARLHAE